MNEEALVKLAIDLDVSTDNVAADKKILVEKVNWLIINDLERLVNILYRIDVSEAKINLFLKELANEDAAEIIVNLMLEREAAKIKSRQQFKKENTDDDEERW